MRAKKGSSFERKICKFLSNWWTGGERDDVFWRSSQSGGRATERAKKGLRTYGSYGDIAAVDPVGESLLKLFTIELKRGSSYKTPADLLDFKEKNAAHPFVSRLFQAYDSHKQAGSLAWMMICKRDHRESILYLPIYVLHRLGRLDLCDAYPALTHNLIAYRPNRKFRRFHFLGLPLLYFVQHVSSGEIKQACNRLQP